MQPRRLPLALSILALAACSRDDASPPVKPKPAPSSTAAKTATTDPPAPRASASAAPTITPEARRAYASHLKEGRKLAADKKWGEATTELEKALGQVPGDPRALVDLGWAALQAGDPKKAKRANREALRRAPDAETKAKALYNLGRIAEADGKRDDAIKAYGESLRLRPNETVQKQLDALAKPAAPSPSASASAAPTSVTTAQPLPCTAPTPLEEVTGCIAKTVKLVDDPDVEDTRVAETVAIDKSPDVLQKKISVVRAPESRFEDQFVLVASSLRGWATVADLGHTYNPGAFGIHEEITVPKAEVREIKDHKVLWLEVLHSRYDSDLGVDEDESTEQRDVVLCVLADEKRKETVCPLKLPLSMSFKRARMGLTELDEETKRLSTPGLPITKETSFVVTIGDDGVVSTKLAKGAPDDRTKPLLGPKKLW